MDIVKKEGYIRWSETIFQATWEQSKFIVFYYLWKGWKGPMSSERL